MCCCHSFHLFACSCATFFPLVSLKSLSLHSLNNVSRKFQKDFWEFSRLLQESFKGVSRKTEGCFEGDLIKGGFKDISEQFKGCCEEPSMVV